MEEACQAVQDRISSVGGSFNFHMKPKVVTATGEADLAKQLERAEQENAEVNIIMVICHAGNCKDYAFTTLETIFFNNYILID